MRPSVNCYPIPGKGKASRLCEAFAAGAVRCGVRAYVWTAAPRTLDRGAAAFYGVKPVVAHLWHQAQREGRDWYYLDNSYFDADRERYFRVTKNAVQVSTAPWLGVGADDRPFPRPAPWRQDGRHIIVCPQSDEFMRTVCGIPDGAQGWVRRVTRELSQLTRRLLVVRWKTESRPFAVDLVDAWALVTHSSAAAVEAAMAGVPVFVTGACAASAVAMNPGTGTFSRVEERPAGFDARPAWAEGLKRSQWTLEQITRGDAWRSLNP